jgi:hypothetical protein
MARMDTLAGFVGWRASSIPTGERGMVSEEGRWDPATALGLRSSERALVVGNPAFLPWIGTLYEHRPENLEAARKPNDIATLVRDGQEFRWMVLAREVPYSHDHVLLAAALAAELVCFPSDDGWQMEQSIEFYYPDAPIWRFDTTFGIAVAAAPRGPSWRVIHG